MSNTKYAYTLSSRNNMVEDIIISISTLKNYVSSDEIVVYYTPPYNDQDEEKLRELGINLIKEENETNPFNIFEGENKSHYGEKIKSTQLDCQNLVFLDCDTVILNDIRKVLEGGFDVKARPGTTGEEDEEWRNLFERFDEEYLDFMPNAGFLVFKNRTHQDIGEKWLEYVNTDLEYDRGVNHQEQYALALATGDKEWKKMSSEEHTFGWEEEPGPETVVYHKGTDSMDRLSVYMKKWVMNKIP